MSSKSTSATSGVLPRCALVEYDRHFVAVPCDEPDVLHVEAEIGGHCADLGVAEPLVLLGARKITVADTAAATARSLERA